MLNKLSAVLRYDSAGEWRAIVGELPDEAGLKQLKAIAQLRPAARKFRSGMVICVPTSATSWHFWVLENVPPVSELAELLSRFQSLSAGFAAEEDSPATVQERPIAPSVGTPMLLPRIALASAQIGQLSPKALARRGLQDIVEAGAATSAVLLDFRGSKLRRKWLSDQRLENHSDEIAVVASSERGETALRRQVEASSVAEEDLEAALLARRVSASSLTLMLPPAGQSGYGLVAFGSPADAMGELGQLLDMMTVVAPQPIGSPLRRNIRRGLAAAALVAAAVWLALPTPIIINATGTTSATEAMVAALPTEGFLKAMHVRVGDEVTAGAAIAEFFSPRLDEAKAEETLNISVEDTNAQTALAENNYGAYQLATQRKAIAETKLKQIEERQARLAMGSPASGRVISALSGSTIGTFQQLGTAVAVIQTGPGFRLSLKLARMDASLVKPGMIGVAYFRGLGGRSYTIRVVTPATVLVDAKTGVEMVEAVAEVTDADAASLIVGLSGYARLEGERAPRFVSYGRYAAEFVRVNAWTYLGLHL